MNIQTFLQGSDIFNQAVFWNALISILIIICIWLLRRAILRMVMPRLASAEQRYRWNKVVQTVAIFLAIALIAPMWMGGFQNAATFLGLLSAGLAITLQEFIQNIAAWVVIVLRQPFKVGDRVQIGNYAGDVIDQGVLQFSLIEIGNWVDADQSTGRILNVPNSLIFKEVLANYYSGFDFIWNEVQVLITHDSNWQKAKTLLLEIITKHAGHLVESARKHMDQASRQYLVYSSNLTPAVYTCVVEKGIILTVRYVCKPRQRRNSAQTVWEEILEVFSQHADIQFMRAPQLSPNDR
jgi:small-conductance mechanosensitive channel